MGTQYKPLWTTYCFTFGGSEVCGKILDMVKFYVARTFLLRTQQGWHGVMEVMSFEHIIYMGYS